MTATSNLKPKPAQQDNAALSAPRRQCLADAARSLGATDELALSFADSGAIAVAGLAMHVMPTGSADGGWLAAVQMPRPVGVPPALWTDALLLANGQSMLVNDWAFGLEENGDGVLLMPLPEDLLDAPLLAGRLDGMLALCRAVSAGAEEASGTGPAPVAAEQEGVAA